MSIYCSYKNKGGIRKESEKGGRMEGKREKEQGKERKETGRKEVNKEADRKKS
jgi:hypothetical protein